MRLKDLNEMEEAYRHLSKDDLVDQCKYLHEEIILHRRSVRFYRISNIYLVISFLIFTTLEIIRLFK